MKIHLRAHLFRLMLSFPIFEHCCFRPLDILTSSCVRLLVFYIILRLVINVYYYIHPWNRSTEEWSMVFILSHNLNFLNWTLSMGCKLLMVPIRMNCWMETDSSNTTTMAKLKEEEEQEKQEEQEAKWNEREEKNRMQNFLSTTDQMNQRVFHICLEQPSLW